MFKQAQSFVVDVVGGVQVAIMMDTAGACPFAIREREISVDEAARAAGFGGWEEPANNHQVGIVPISLVFQHRTEHAPTSIKDALGQLGFRKPTNVQIFNRHEVVVTNQISSQLVQEVIPLIAGLLMQSRQHDSRLATVAAPLRLATECLLCAPEFARLCAIPARVVDPLPGGKSSQGFKADINADAQAGGWQRLRADLTDDGGVPAIGAASDRTGLRRAGEGSISVDAERPQLRQDQLPVTEAGSVAPLRKGEAVVPAAPSKNAGSLPSRSRP